MAGETLWATRIADGVYRIDNVPFFVKGVSFDDEVAAQIVDGVPTYESLLRAGGHSTIRVAVEDPDDVARMREALTKLGASSELSHIDQLVAVDVPPSADWGSIITFLGAARDRGELDYEEGTIADGHRAYPEA